VVRVVNFVSVIVFIFLDVCCDVVVLHGFVCLYIFISFLFVCLFVCLFVLFCLFCLFVCFICFFLSLSSCFCFVDYLPYPITLHLYVTLYVNAMDHVYVLLCNLFYFFINTKYKFID
jgi:hypothetical protein